MRCQDVFLSEFHLPCENIAFAPYRICPIGAHSDHNFGKITGMALDRGVYIAWGFHPQKRIDVKSLQFQEKVGWDMCGSETGRKGDWADYLRGASVMLNRRFPLHSGIRAVVEGTLPIGGLSSSAAVILAFLKALSAANGIELTDRQLIDIAFEAESEFVGVSVGKLDQSCEVLSRKGCLLYLDTLNGNYERIAAPVSMKPYRIAVFFSGLEHSLVGSAYNMRVDELRAGIYAVKAFSGMEYGRFRDTAARQVSYETYLRCRDKLPEAWARRCDHWYTEFRRVEEGAEAWRNGDIETFGRLSFESGWSSIHNWESAAPEQIRLYEIMRETEGIYGGRFSGAGFKGCCIALIDPEYEDSITQKVTDAYLSSFPHLQGKFAVYMCNSADGVGRGA